MNQADQSFLISGQILSVLPGHSCPKQVLGV
jgi:hypothetical protein